MNEEELASLVTENRSLQDQVAALNQRLIETQAQLDAAQKQLACLQPRTPKRVLIFMSDTGGGHRACAESLRAAFTERYPEDYKVDMIDLWMKHTPWPLNSMPKSYRFLANDAQWFYRFVYRATEKPKVMAQIMDAAGVLALRSFKHVIWNYDPDLIVCVHPLLQAVPLKALARMGRQIPFVTVVTELASVHPIWFHHEVKLLFVANEEVRRMALASGVLPERLREYGLPIRTAFAQASRSKEELRRELKLEPDVPVVLLVGGGEGIGPVAEIGRAIVNQLALDTAARGQLAGQLVIICGRNRKLWRELAMERWPIPTRVQGFVNNMSDWMAASDLIVTKAGSYTIAEALARGLPILLSGYIAGQEEGNVPYVVENGVGDYCEEPEGIAGLVSRWFGIERSKLEAMAHRAQQLGRPQATYQITDEIARFLS